MPIAYVLAALLSAILHAGWNAAVKASPDPTRAMAGQMLVSALIAVPILAWAGLPATGAWPWMAASTLMNVASVAALLRAYASAGFGVAYPIARAVSVLLVVPLAAAIAGETLSLTALLGIGLITLSLAILSLGAGADKGLSPTALLWTLVAGVTTAGYVLCDAQGVRQSGSAWAYGALVSILNAAAMSWRIRHLGSPVAHVRATWAVAVPAAVAAMASYLIILWVWTRAPIAAATALRDTSAVFAVLIAVLWLREPLGWHRIAAVLLAAAAVPLLRAG
ncbi:MAG: EamA family transporter [Hyphomicrobiaceae bacterium]|nr:EamA family transporter [Hyphomicrobiaceae bacterium]